MSSATLYLVDLIDMPFYVFRLCWISLKMSKVFERFEKKRVSNDLKMSLRHDMIPLTSTVEPFLIILHISF